MNERKPDALRAQARRLHADGRSINAIAKCLNVTFSTIQRWLQTDTPADHCDSVWLLAVSGSWRKAA